MRFHLFGSSTSAGYSFRQQAFNEIPGLELFFYSRNADNIVPAFGTGLYFDLTSPESFSPPITNADPSVFISFAPIWLFSEFLEYLELQMPYFLTGLTGLIACSSSSSISKRFAANRFDSDLAMRLARAEAKIIDICQRFHIPCHILLPTLIYGCIGPYQDKNLSYVLKIMRQLPFLPVPSESGLRQPIHAKQLASLFLSLSRNFLSPEYRSSLPVRLAIGGDASLSYVDMLRALQLSQPSYDKAHRCKLVKIPNRLFFLLSVPLLLMSPKAFEAVLRMCANLAGFTPVHELTGGDYQAFPILPLD